MEQESAKFGLHVSWSEAKVQNLGAGPDADDVFIGAPKSGRRDGVNLSWLKVCQ